MMVAAVGLMAVPDRINMPPDAVAGSGPVLPYLGTRASPGIEVGVTDYDWMQNGSMGRYVWRTAIGGFQFYWTYRYGGSNDNRRAYYNYYYPPDYWLGPTAMDNDQSRMGAMDQFSDGRAVGSAHALAVSTSRIYIDAVEGAGAFSIITPLYQGDPNTAPIWPKVVVDTDDNIFLAASQNPGPFGWWNKSTDEGTTWRGWDSTLAGVELNTTNYDYGGHECWTHSLTTPWMSLVNGMGDTYGTIVYYETGDAGNVWYYDTIWAFSPGDSVQGYLWHSACYDANEYVHAVFVLIDTMPLAGGASGSGWRSQIWHWNQQTDQMSQVDNGMGWINSNPGPGANHPTVSEPQLTLDQATGDLYCTWCYADPTDVAANGLVNMDIWGARSTDNGATWIEHHNITNSPTPGAVAGQCDNDHVNTLAEYTMGDTLIMFYINDKDAGNAAFPPDPGATLTDSPMLFYLYEWNPGAVAEHTVTTPMKLALSIRPNPSVQNTQISYSMSRAGSVSLKLYSVDGRLVETVYSGSRDAGVYVESIDARQLSSGTYFVILDVAGEQVTQSLVVVR